MLGFEMKDIDWENGMLKKLVFLFLEMRLKLAVIVVKYDIWKVFWIWINRF
jgi:hypothetical protein